MGADYLYICHNTLEVCKLNSCSETLLVLTDISGTVRSSYSLDLVVNPIKRSAPVLHVIKMRTLY